MRIIAILSPEIIRYAQDYDALARQNATSDKSPELTRVKWDLYSEGAVKLRTFRHAET